MYCQVGYTKTLVRANLDFGLAIHSTRDRPRLATVAFSARSRKAVDDFYAARFAVALQKGNEELEICTSR
jgi:hypothetical protein